MSTHISASAMHMYVCKCVPCMSVHHEWAMHVLTHGWIYHECICICECLPHLSMHVCTHECICHTCVWRILHKCMGVHIWICDCICHVCMCINIASCTVNVCPGTHKSVENMAAWGDWVEGGAGASEVLWLVYLPFPNSYFPVCLGI